MPLNAYNKTTWINDQEPSIDEDHLNNIEDGIDTNRNALITLQSQVGSFSVARNVLADEYTNSQIDTMISSATGLPSGGTANQVLAKNTSTDYDAEWKTMSASNTTYSKTSSGLSATTVQGAIDELANFDNDFESITIADNVSVPSGTGTGTTVGTVTIPKGTYLYTFTLTFDSNATGFRAVTVGTGTTISLRSRYTNKVQAVSGTNTYITLPIIYNLNNPATYNVNCMQNSGSALGVSVYAAKVKLK